MISPAEKESLIKHLLNGMNVAEACKASKVSKATLYRLFEKQPAFKALVFEAMETYEKRVSEKSLDHLKKMILKR